MARNGSEEDKSWWGQITLTRRRMVFFYDVLWLAVLGLIGLYLASVYNCKDTSSDADCWILALLSACPALLVKYKTLINCAWFGALGGVTISLKGVYDHGNPNDPWTNAFNLWHIGRPLSGAVAGLIVSVLFLLVFPANTLSPLVLYGVAFIFGTQDAAFFDFLSEFASRFVKSSKPGQVGVRINSVSPPHGAPGITLTIVGQGFEPEATVKVGPTEIKNYTMTADGTTISGPLPAIPGLAADGPAIDVIVMNKSGSSAALVGKFKYDAPPAASAH
jgi:hypothetical protein